jgi:hypothetical protein
MDVASNRRSRISFLTKYFLIILLLFGCLLLALNNHFLDTIEHRSAGLNCDNWGGPSHDAAQEMVYWEDIPSDERFASPFHQSNGPTQYLTFEPDGGGWNNIR